VILPFSSAASAVILSFCLALPAVVIVIFVLLLPWVVRSALALRMVFRLCTRALLLRARPLLRVRAWRCLVGALVTLVAAAFLLGRSALLLLGSLWRPLLLRRSALLPLSSLWRPFSTVLLVGLPRYRFTRLVTVTLVVELMLLLRAGISIP
jgi:hypothetical protein